VRKEDKWYNGVTNMLEWNRGLDIYIISSKLFLTFFCFDKKNYEKKRNYMNSKRMMWKINLNEKSIHIIVKWEIIIFF
jgi:hypothetical protein